MGKIAAVVLAAGKGKRMKSEMPKVLFPVAGKPMLQHIVDALQETGIKEIYTVVGYGAAEVQTTIKGPITWVDQKGQLGTGHALSQAAAHLRGFGGQVLVLAGDIPLLTADTLSALIVDHVQGKNAATVLSARVPQPAGYGRVIRTEEGRVVAIIEDKDTDSRQKEINEINASAYCFTWGKVEPLLELLGANNAQGEYYLTDVIALLARQGEKIGAHVARDFQEILGPNNREQLAQAEKIMRRRICSNLMGQGVSIIDPDSTWIDAAVQIDADTTVYPNTFIHGNTKIGGNCVIGPNVTIDSSSLGKKVIVHYAVIKEATVGDGVAVGPFAYLRPGAVIGAQAKIGDFVEIKNSQIGEGTKVPHLTYVGDAQVGKNTNIGCGVITANYNGINKNQTKIGDGVFIGSNANLVAPVQVEDGAFIAAGSTITEDVPAGALAIARARQTTKPDWRKKG